MSALGQKRTLELSRGMSALCQKQTHAPQQKRGYSITSSARASSEGGTVRPSILDHLSGDQLFDPRPIFEAVTPGIIEVGRWVVRDRTEAWPRLDALEPILKVRPTFPHSGESEPVDPLDVRRDLDVGKGEHVRRQPFRPASLRFDLAKGLIKYLDVIQK